MLATKKRGGEGSVAVEGPHSKLWTEQEDCRLRIDQCQSEIEKRLSAEDQVIAVWRGLRTFVRLIRMAFLTDQLRWGWAGRRYQRAPVSIQDLLKEVER